VAIAMDVPIRKESVAWTWRAPPEQESKVDNVKSKSDNLCGDKLVDRTVLHVVSPTPSFSETTLDPLPPRFDNLRSLSIRAP